MFCFPCLALKNLSNLRYLNFCCPKYIYISQSSCSGGTCTGRAAGHVFFCVCLNYPEVYRMNMEYETLNDLLLMILVFS